MGHPPPADRGAGLSPPAGRAALSVFRQTYKPREFATMLGWGLRTVYRKIAEGTVPVLELDGEPVRPYRIPIQKAHALFPELRCPFQLPLDFFRR